MRHCLVIALSAALSVSHAGYRDDVGFTQLANELGSAMPDGSGQRVIQVEVLNGNGNYLPNGSQINTSTTITPMSGTTGGTSLHATFVGEHIYSTGGIATGLDEVLVYESDDWLGSGFLNAESTALPVATPLPKIQNHSWVGSNGFAVSSSSGLRLDQEILRRVDFVANRDGTFFAVGVNNENGGYVPLLAQGYNSLSVGVSKGTHDAGATTTEGNGRFKPEIVSEDDTAGFTSFATAVVTGMAAVLTEVAVDNAYTDATDGRVLKAILMAGASKEEFADWDRTTERPIDEIYGSGEANLYNSHQILTAGPAAPSTMATVSRQGWSFTNLPANTSHDFFFDVPRGFLLEDVSVMLVWNREIATQLTTGGAFRTWTPTLRDLNLSFSTAENLSKVTQLDSSESDEHNLEHIWQPDTMGAGQYAFTVTQGNGGATDYALAWRSQLRTPNTYDEWLLAYLNASGISAADKANDADPEADHLSNLLEYATGSDPLINDGQVISVTNTSGEHRIAFPWRYAASDIALAFDVTRDLRSGFTRYTDAEVVAGNCPELELDSVTTLDDTFETRVYRVLTPEATFVRLIITQPSF